jgi:hypothetical protein
MLFGKNYFKVVMNGKKVKIDTDKTEFNISVKDGKATFDVEAEPEVENLDCSDFCDYCKECCEEPIPEVVVEDNKPDTININVNKDGDTKPKTTKKKTLDTVC